MAAFDYARTKASADRLIARFGVAAILRVPTTASGPKYNPTKGVPDDHPITVVVLDYQTREVDGARILSTDKKVLIAKGSLTIDPVPGHKLVLGGVEYTIPGEPNGKGVSKISPGGVTVLFEAQARR